MITELNQCPWISKSFFEPVAFRNHLPQLTVQFVNLNLPVIVLLLLLAGKCQKYLFQGLFLPGTVLIGNQTAAAPNGSGNSSASGMRPIGRELRP